MNDIVRTDIIRIFADCITMIDSKDFFGLKELSDHTIHNASIFQDADSVSAAVMIYSISKMFENKKEIDPKIIGLINKIKDSLEKNNYTMYKESLASLYRAISTVDSKVKYYAQEVIDKAKVKKSSKIYDHGISMSQSAQILGTNIWDLMNYVGKTKIADSFEEKSSIAKRLTLVRQIFEDRQ